MDELISSLTSVSTYDPEQEYDKLLNSYNTPFDISYAFNFLVDSKKRYKSYLYSINFDSYPELHGNITAFVNSFFENQNYNEYQLRVFFQMTKSIDKFILDLLS